MSFPVGGPPSQTVLPLRRHSPLEILKTDGAQTLDRRTLKHGRTLEKRTELNRWTDRPLKMCGLLETDGAQTLDRRTDRNGRTLERVAAGLSYLLANNDVS